MAFNTVTAPHAPAARYLPDDVDTPLPLDRAFTEDEIAELRREMDEAGYAVVPNYIASGELESLQRFVREKVAAAGNTYTLLNGPEPVAETPLARIGSSTGLRHACMRLYELATGRRPPDEPYYQIVRCLTGSSGHQYSMIFHFDSYVLTVLLPVEVPYGKDSGELIMLPNVRDIRNWYASNLLDKVLLDNPLTQKALRHRAQRHPERFVRIHMVPGNLYFFWGYRSVHTNAPCDIDKVRATALFHYADPHNGSRLKKLLRG